MKTAGNDWVLSAKAKKMPHSCPYHGRLWGIFVLLRYPDLIPSAGFSRTPSAPNGELLYSAACRTNSRTSPCVGSAAMAPTLVQTIAPT